MAVVSSIFLLGDIATLGINFVFVRYLPDTEVNQVNLMSTGFVAAGVASLLVSIVYLIGLPLWAPGLSFILDGYLFLIGILFGTLAWTVFSLLDELFIGLRCSKFVVIKNGAFNLVKLIAVILLGGFGANGIFGTWFASLLLVLFGIAYFAKRYQRLNYPPSFKKLGINPGVLMRFSVANYLASLSRLAPGHVFTIMIVNLVSPAMGAFFFIAWTIATFVSGISFNISNAMLAEASARLDHLHKQVRKALLFAFLIVTPTVVLVVTLGDRLLLLFGEEYSLNATSTFKLLAIATIPVIWVNVFLAIKRAEEDNVSLIIVPVALIVGAILLGYWLLGRYGMIGIGVAWLVVHTVAALLVTPKLFKLSFMTERMLPIDRSLR